MLKFDCQATFSREFRLYECPTQAWRKLENSEGATSAEPRFHGGEAPEKNLDFRAKIVKISNSE